MQQCRRSSSKLPEALAVLLMLMCAYEPMYVCMMSDPQDWPTYECDNIEELRKKNIEREVFDHIPHVSCFSCFWLQPPGSSMDIFSFGAACNGSALAFDGGPLCVLNRAVSLRSGLCTGLCMCEKNKRLRTVCHCKTTHQNNGINTCGGMAVKIGE